MDLNEIKVEREQQYFGRKMLLIKDDRSEKSFEAKIKRL